MTLLHINTAGEYEIHFTGKYSTKIEVDGEEVYDLIVNGPCVDRTKELKEMYVSISRAIEDGNDFKVGVVIGQVLTKLNELINEAE
jgi:hypothetical protein